MSTEARTIAISSCTVGIAGSLMVHYWGSWVATVAFAVVVVLELAVAFGTMRRVDAMKRELDRRRTQ